MSLVGTLLPRELERLDQEELELWAKTALGVCHQGKRGHCRLSLESPRTTRCCRPAGAIAPSCQASCLRATGPTAPSPPLAGKWAPSLEETFRETHDGGSGIPLGTGRVSADACGQERGAILRASLLGKPSGAPPEVEAACLTLAPGMLVQPLDHVWLSVSVSHPQLADGPGEWSLCAEPTHHLHRRGHSKPFGQ